MDSNYTERDETEDTLDSCAPNDQAVHKSDTEFVAVGARTLS